MEKVTTTYDYHEHTCKENKYLNTSPQQIL